MTSTQYQDATPSMQQQDSTQQGGYLVQQQQQKAMQPTDARTAKRIKVEHGEEQTSTFQSPSPSPMPSSSNQQAPVNGQGKSITASQPLVLPTPKPSQQMGPPLNSRPSMSAVPSYNGEASSPATPSATHSPSPQPSQQGVRANVGPGRTPYQFGMGLPSPGINFTRTPTTGSFVANNSNSNSRQQTPTDSNRNTSRQSPSETKAGPQASSSAPTFGGGGGGARRDGVDQLQDLLSISGVDLRAEEEAAQRSSMARTSYNTATAAAQQASVNPQLRQTPFYLEIYPLSRQIHRIAAKHGLRVEPEVLTYLSLAAKTRFQNLLEAMIASSRHRNWSSHLRPPPMYEKSGQAMYHEEINDDPLKLLAALTRVEKREEQDARQARIQREEMEANNVPRGPNAEEGSTRGEGTSSGQNTPAERSKEGGGGGEDGKKKSKKPGSSSTARNMSEDKRLKLANKTAAQALGIPSNSKAWMFGGGSGSNSPFGSTKAAGGGSSKLPKPRFAPVASGKGEGNDDNNGGQSLEGGAGQSETGQGGETPAGSSIKVGGWGDLAARQRLKEEEERQARRRVNLQDALHALEMERSGGAGRGSGEAVLFSTMALGRPPSRRM